jgi:ribosomal protein S18 acetylase RimI-like enzyme
MPVILEHLTDLSADDRSDLIKLYQDYPSPPTHPSHVEKSPDKDPQHWISNNLSNGLLLFAGRFNGRLLCAVWAKPSPSGWQLLHLCVRSVTRRRGVARQLLTLLSQYADARHIALSINASDAPEKLTPLLAELGFTVSKNSASTGHSNWIKAASAK